MLFIYLLKKCILLLSKDALTEWKVTVKAFMMLQQIYISNNAGLLKFLFIKERVAI